MRLVVAGLNHRTAPLDVRERLAVTSEGLPEALRALCRHLGQGVILSTCNRAEFYTVGQDGGWVWTVLEDFAQEHLGVSMGGLARHFYVKEHAEAARHLFLVASGLDSMVLGESQILGQVRNGYSAGVAWGGVRHPLSRVFHQALRVGKRVRRETGIGQNSLSISYACVELARRVVGELRGRRALVIGAGEAGKLAARALQNHGVTDVSIANRTRGRAEELSREMGGVVVPWEEIEGALAGCDIVISSTDSPEYLLSRSLVEAALAGRSAPLFLLDIAVPRDIDPLVAEVPGAHLFDIDDLEAVTEANREVRRKEAEKARAIVEEEVQRFVQWWGGLRVVPTIARLRERAEALRVKEVARALKRLSDAGEEEKAVMEGLSRALVNKLLHGPISVLKQEGREEHIKSARELFGLQEPGDGAS